MHKRLRAGLTAGVALLTLATAACGSGGGGAGQASASGKTGGTISVRGCTPQNPLIAGNTSETCGGNVITAITSELVHYNSDTAAPELDLAQSVDTTDNVHFTVKLKQGQKFDDGTEVKARNFVDAWNTVAYGPNGYQGGYFFEPIKGYQDVQCADAKCTTPPATKQMSGLQVTDDYTFTIETTSPVSNLLVRLGYSAFAPMPDAFLNNITSDTFGKMPVGNGPFKVTANDATQIVLEKNQNYSGAWPAHVDKIIYRIYNDASTAFTDVVANNLDFTDTIPTDQLAGDAYKKTVGDRSLIKPVGIFQWVTFSPTDDQLKNVDLRKALSMAVDRQSITQTVFNNTRTPADSWVSPVVDGYKAGVCGDACKYDAAAAKALYDKAGGYKGTLLLSVNGDGGHQQWAQAACNSMKNALGVDCQVNTTPDFKTLRNKIQSGELTGMFRGGWQMDYPSIEDFLTPIYAKNAASNDAKYDNPAFDAKLAEAAAAPDLAKANALYQEAEAMLATDMPTMPLWFSSVAAAWSTKVTNVKVTAFGTLDYSAISLK